MTEQEKTQSIIVTVKTQNAFKELTHQQIITIIDLGLEGFSTNGQEDWQDHYIKERIKRNVLAELEKENFKPSQTGVPLKWFKFYTYFRIPAGILLSLVWVSFLLHLDEYLILPLVLLIFNMIILIILFIGLSTKKLWGWKFNFFVLIYETVIISFNSVSNLGKDRDSLIFAFLLALITVCLVWLLPNWIYFKKRKYLFN